MQPNTLMKQADAFFDLAEGIADRLTKGQSLLRAKIAKAEFARDAYVAMQSHSKQSPLARSFVAEARRRYERTLKDLVRTVLKCFPISGEARPQLSRPVVHAAFS